MTEPAPLPIPPEWRCPYCGTLNTGRRRLCRFCREARPMR
jgi:hypothetical protein